MRASGTGRSLAREVLLAIRRAGRGGRPGARADADAADGLPSESTFIRGLSIGALVGAAIAGSAIWERRHGRRKRRTDAAVPDLKARPGRPGAGSTRS